MEVPGRSVDCLYDLRFNSPLAELCSAWNNYFINDREEWEWSVMFCWRVEAAGGNVSGQWGEVLARKSNSGDRPRNFGILVGYGVLVRVMIINILFLHLWHAFTFVGDYYDYWWAQGNTDLYGVTLNGKKSYCSQYAALWMDMPGCWPHFLTLPLSPASYRRYYLSRFINSSCSDNSFFDVDFLCPHGGWRWFR